MQHCRLNYLPYSNLSCILSDIDDACTYFATVSYDQMYNISYFEKFWKLPDNVHVDTDISPVNVERLLRKTRSTSPSPDDLPCWLFQQCSVELTNIVLHIFNCSILSGTVPSQWLTAIDTPIPKIPRPMYISDLRTISVIPILSVVIEKNIVEKGLRPAIPYQIIADQFSFRSTASNTTAALVISDAPYY